MHILQLPKKGVVDLHLYQLATMHMQIQTLTDAQGLMAYRLQYVRALILQVIRPYTSVRSGYVRLVFTFIEQ